jgi:hypothetical protein
MFIMFMKTMRTTFDCIRSSLDTLGLLATLLVPISYCPKLCLCVIMKKTCSFWDADLDMVNLSVVQTRLGDRS